MPSVTFNSSVGGDGSTVTDDSSPTTGLASGGHRTRFVPALAQLVAVAGFVVTKANQFFSANGITGTSSTSLTIGTGSKSLTIETGKSFVAGQPIRISSQASPDTVWMQGTVTSYNSGTGALVVNVTGTAGSGTLASWTAFVNSQTDALTSAFIQTLLDDVDASAAQTTLGISAYIKTLLDDVDASAAQTTLGISAYIKTLLDDADASTARTTLGALSSANNAVAYANLQDITATQRVLGRDTAGAGDPEEVTLSQLLDWIGPAAQGDILYRAASSWARLAAGTAGQALKTGGAGANPSWGTSGITLGTPVNSTSGTSIDFTAIPSGTKRIVISLSGVSTSGTSELRFRLGDGGGIESTGYSCAYSNLSTGVTTTNGTDGFGIAVNAATNTYSGLIQLDLMDASTNTWACMGMLGLSDTARLHLTAGVKSTSAVLDRIRITTAGGTDTFDAGKINIAYE